MGKGKDSVCNSLPRYPSGIRNRTVSKRIVLFHIHNSLADTLSQCTGVMAKLTAHRNSWRDHVRQFYENHLMIWY